MGGGSGCQLTTSVFIGAIATILFTVTEQATFNTVTITASQETILTQGFIGVEQRLDTTFLVLGFAVLDGLFPIASLFFNIEIQTGGTTNSLETLENRTKENVSKNIIFFFKYVIRIKKEFGIQPKI